MFEEEPSAAAGGSGAASAAPRPGFSRRRALAGIGAGAAIAWTAPQILSAPAASAATCQPASMSFDANQQTLGTIQNGGTTFVPFGATEQIQVTFDNTTGLSPGATGTFDVNQPVPLGAVFNDFGSLNMTGQSVNDFVELSFAFSIPVDSLTVTLLDVDLGEAIIGPVNFWTDQATVTGTLAAAPVAIGSASFNATFVSQTSPGVFEGIFDPSGTGAGVPNTDPSANVTIQYNAPIDNLVIRYTALGPGVEDQQIGVAFLDFCI